MITDVVAACLPDSRWTRMSALPVLSAGESEVEIDLTLELWSSHEGGNTNFWKSFISNFSPIWPLVPEIIRFFSGGKSGSFGGNVRWVGHDSILALGKGSFHGRCRSLCAGLARDLAVGVDGLVCWNVCMLQHRFSSAELNIQDILDSTKGQGQRQVFIGRSDHFRRILRKMEMWPCLFLACLSNLQVRWSLHYQIIADFGNMLPATIWKCLILEKKSW